MKSLISISLIGLTLTAFTPSVFAGQTTTRTGPRGNTQTTERKVDDGKQTTTRTGPRHNTQTTERKVDDGKQTTTRTGPRGNTQTTERQVND